MKTKGIIFLLGLIPFFASAQFTGAGSAPTSLTVKQIREQAYRLDKNDVIVQLTGSIVQQINKDTYLFRDHSGSIQVEVSKKNLPGKPFNEKTGIMITGKVDHDLLEETEIEVSQITFIN